MVTNTWCVDGAIMVCRKIGYCYSFLPSFTLYYNRLAEDSLYYNIKIYTCSVNSIFHYIHIMYYRCILGYWNKHILRDIWLPTFDVMMWPWRCVGWYDVVILFCLASHVYFNCIVHDSLYYTINICAMWHLALVSCIPSQSQSKGHDLSVRCYCVECHFVFLLLIPF